jgi:membrane protease YdiL (CAAX protease family)
MLVLLQQGLKPATFQALGLGRPRHWWTTPLWALGIIVGVTLAVAVIARPLAAALDLPAQDLSRLGDLAGNPQQLALMLAIAWTTAAVGEEILFRGYLIPRLERLFGGGGLAVTIAVVAQAGLFALAHSTQGPQGAIQAGIVALTFGVAFLATRRNLWALILAHGLIDTISLTALYAGHAPA